MKANRDFKIFTNKEGTLVSYYSGDPTDNIIKIDIKKGEEIPNEILEPIIENIPDYVNFKSKSEIKPKKETAKKVPEPAKPVEKKVEPKKYTKEELESFAFSKLKEIAEKLGHTGRSKTGLIKDILDNQ